MPSSPSVRNDRGMLAVDHLTKSFGDRPVVENWSLHVDPGTAAFLTGANGAGKSTILKCLAGTERSEYSRFTWAGDPCSPTSAAHWRRFHCVADDFAWFPDLSVLDHLVMLGDERRGLAALEALNAATLADRTLASLSTGQAQRAALATSAVRDWDVLLLDEPEQRLDDDGVRLLADMLLRFLAAGRVVVAATHSTRLIQLVGGRTVPCGTAPE